MLFIQYAHINYFYDQEIVKTKNNTYKITENYFFLK